MIIKENMEALRMKTTLVDLTPATSTRFNTNPEKKISGVVLALFLIFFFCARGFAAPVDVNTASADAMADALAGVGPKIASAIVQYREKNGPFTSVEDLLSIKGIGPKVLEKNKADLLIDNQSPKSTTE